MNILTKEKERSSLANANDAKVRAYVDEIVSRAPRLSDKQLDAVAGALDIKGAK